MVFTTTFLEFNGTLYTLAKFVVKLLYCLGKGKGKSKGEGKGEGQGHCQGHGEGSRVRVRLSRSGSICGVVRVKVGVAVIGYWLLLLLLLSSNCDQGQGPLQVVCLLRHYRETLHILIRSNRVFPSVLLLVQTVLWLPSSR